MRYRKKPVEVDAVQWTGKNNDDILAFADCEVLIDNFHETLEIKTLEGIMTASKGDYIIKGVHGEFYPCKPDIFIETYEKV